MSFLARAAAAVRWLRGGYPDDAPHHGYVPLLALMDPRLSPDQIREVVTVLERQGPASPDAVDIQVAITAVVAHRLPTRLDVERVRTALTTGTRPSPPPAAAPSPKAGDRGNRTPPVAGWRRRLTS